MSAIGKRAAPESVPVAAARAPAARAFASWPVFAEDEIEAAARVLRSGRVNYWTGSEVGDFEREFAEYVGADHAIAIANGTLALELALHALALGPGDEVIVPAHTFIATASAVVMRGAVPVVADVDRHSRNVTAASIEAVRTPCTRAVIVVHLAGWPCEMDEILALARRHDLKVVEDCAQATGAAYRDKRVGTLGDVGAFSFCQDKILSSAGEGGMLVTNDERLWSRAWAYKDHGKSQRLAAAPPDAPGFRWLHEEFGSNWRLTAVQAAIGRVQLRKLAHWLARRRGNAAVLDRGFAAIDGLAVTVPTPHEHHAYYKYYVLLEPDRLRDDWDRDRILAEIIARGVPCFSGACTEIYREAAFAKAGLAPSDRLPNVAWLERHSLMFLVHPTLDEEDMHYTVDTLRSVMARAVQ